MNTLVKRYLNRISLCIIALLLLCHPLVLAGADYTDFYVQITDATTAVHEGNQQLAQEIVVSLQAAFAKEAHVDTVAGQNVVRALQIEGEVEESDLVAISKALLAFEAEQNPVDTTAEKAKLMKNLTPAYAQLQAAIDQKDIKLIKEEFKYFNSTWTRNEGIARVQAAHYGQIETAISFLNAATVTEPVDFEVIQSSFDEVKRAVQAFVDGENVGDSNQNLTLTDGINLLTSALADFESGHTAQASTTMKEFIAIWPSIEGDISTRDNALYTRVESESPVIMVKGADKTYQGKLKQLIADLSAIDTAATYNYFDAALILLREGVEALLIVLALISTLRASKQQKGLPWIYAGALTGVIASVGIAYLLQTIFPVIVAGTQREILEGAVGIFAVVMMLFVGIWLHRKSSVQEWNAFMDKQMEQVTATGSFVSMFILAFLAVFREGAETILFYVGIWPHISSQQLLLGIGLAVVTLVLIGLAMLKLTQKLVAYRVFFYLSWLIYGLAFKMLGVSIHALQLTNILPTHLIDGFPTIELLGLYPSWEVVCPQIILLFIIVGITVGKLLVQPNPRQSEELTIVEHLSEFRSRLIKVVIAFTVAFVGSLGCSSSLYQWLTASFEQKLIVLGPNDILWIYISLASLMAVVITLPIIAYQIWAYINPALGVVSARAALTYIVAVFLCFVTGLAFGFYLVTPALLNVLLSLGSDLFETQLTAHNYLTFVLHTCVPIAIIFEFPVVIAFLTELTIVKPQILIKYRRYAYFALLCVAVIITPADFVSDIAMTLPLLFIYEFGVIVSKIIYRRKSRK